MTNCRKVGRDNARQMQLLIKVGEWITRLPQRDNLFPAVVAHLHEYFPQTHVALYLVALGRQELILQSASGLRLSSTGPEKKVAGVSAELCSHVAKKGLPSFRLSGEAEVLPVSLEHLPTPYREIAVPLHIKGQVVGVLALESDRVSGSGDLIDEGDLQLLQVVASQLSVALENARLTQEIGQRHQVMSALHHTSLDIISHLDSKRVLQSILRRSVDLLGTRAAALGICEKGSSQVRIIANHNLPTKYRGAQLVRGEGVAGKVVELGEPVCIHDYLHWEGHSALFADTPYDSVLGVPMRWRGEIIGCLVVSDSHERRQFTAEDIELLTSFADLASIAIKNADLYSEVKELSERLEQRVASRTAQLAAAQRELEYRAEQLHGLVRRINLLQEEERARIARDMHDSTTQLILGALYSIEAMKELMETDPILAHEKMTRVQDFLRQIEAEIRQTIHSLRPAVLDTRGIVPALEQYVARYEGLAGIPGSVHVSGTPIRLALEAEVAIYRIVQEALQNITAHANASAVSVTMYFRPFEVEVVVRDDGCGFDPEVITRGGKGHFGLLSMQERASNIGGRLGITSAPKMGTEVQLRVPLQQQ